MSVSIIRKISNSIKSVFYKSPGLQIAVVGMNNFYFDFDKWFLHSESFVEPDRVLKMLAENRAIEKEMSAHTDSRGSDKYNFTLSYNRAKSEVEYILSKGITMGRIILKGHGNSNPFVQNDTDENRLPNRRIKFTKLKN